MNQHIPKPAILAIASLGASVIGLAAVHAYRWFRWINYGEAFKP